MKTRRIKDSLVVALLSLPTFGCAGFMTTYSTISDPSMNGEVVDSVESEFDIPESLGMPVAINSPQNPFDSAASDFTADTEVRVDSEPEMLPNNPFAAMDGAAESQTAVQAFSAPVVAAPTASTDTESFADFADSQPDIQQAAPQFSQPVRLVSNTSSVATFRAAQPRLPSLHGQACDTGCPPTALCAPPVVAAESAVAMAYPDEYICDGGDRGFPVHYDDGDITGLDTEDTIVEYTDSQGKKKLKASNKVCVYAPRFGSIRTVEGLGVDVKVDQAMGARDIAMINSINELQTTDAEVANLPASGFAMREGASGLNMKQPLFESTAAQRPTQNQKVDQRIEARVRTGLNTLRMSQVARFRLEIKGPETSSRRTQLGLETASTAAMSTFATYKLQSVVGSEDTGRPGEVQVAKTANPLSAKSGDVVTFQIHFRNVGDQSVSDVSLMDNLTPRLQYIPNSAEINVSNGGDGDLTVLPNKEGSQLLNFQLDRPLRGGESGYVTFDAKVL